MVDDGSPDGTADLADKVGAELGQVEVLRRAAKAASAPRTAPASGSVSSAATTRSSRWTPTSRTTPTRCPRCSRPRRRGTDLVIGSRYVPGGATPHWPWYRLAISKGGNLYARALLGFRVRDSTAGFRVYSRRALTSFPLDEVRAEGYGFQVEMTYRVGGAGGSITEVPIEFRDRELGTSKMSGRIVVEAFVLVAWWALRDRVLRRGAP